MDVQTLDFNYHFEHEETDDSLILALPMGHKIRDQTIFMDAALCALYNAGFSINGYETTHLYIMSDDRVYDGAFACNTFVQNALIDLFKNGYCVLDLVTDEEDREDIINDWFN